MNRREFWTVILTLLPWLKASRAVPIASPPGPIKALRAVLQEPLLPPIPIVDVTDVSNHASSPFDGFSVDLSFKAIVHDDLDVFKDAPALFARQAEDRNLHAICTLFGKKVT